MNEKISIKGAREHNLKNISIDIPREKLVVITGPSGSGKSSLAFDTLYAEGQRRYVESLSAYARQFLGVQKKPDVDEISGLSPAISIEQKGTGHNPRSTVGTVTEIYDYFRLLYGRIGIPHCPKCGKPVQRHSIDEILDYILKHEKDLKIEIFAPLVKNKKGEFKNLFNQTREKGYTRARVDGIVYYLEEEISIDKNKKHNIEILVDRLKISSDKRSRLAESVEASLKLSGGYVLVKPEKHEEYTMTENYSCPDCEIGMPEIEPRLFSFNNPVGACPDCGGLGSHEHYSRELAIDPERSVLDGAIIPWKTKPHTIEKLKMFAEKHGWDLTKPYKKLSKEVQDFIWNGSGDEKLPMIFDEKGIARPYMGRYEGVVGWLENKLQWFADNENVAEEVAQYREEDICKTCGGLRLRQEALNVKVSGYGIGELLEMPVDKLVNVIKNFKLTKSEHAIIDQVLNEIIKRLEFLVDVGVGYLSLLRRADTLSGGESQRIRLATQIGSNLSGVLYVLDEPTIGLHSRDTEKLIRSLQSIKNLGNTVVVVEHDRETMQAADALIELGPEAGEKGGEILYSGSYTKVLKSNGKTGKYLRGEETGIVRREKRRKPSGWIKVNGAEHHNLKNIDVKIPVGVFSCISGVSGSGKSSFLYDVLYKGMRRILDNDFRERPGKFTSIEGTEFFDNIVLVDQSPIGRTPRSNPATYTGVFSLIREFFASLPEAKIRGYTAGRFSFNVKGGRCEACGGAGSVKTSMLFLPDIYSDCEICKGTRYNHETLEVKFKDKNIADVLAMTVDEAMEFFADIPKIANKLKVIQDAGLGYIQLGQSALTLSGGEAQRVKLSKELSKKFGGRTLYLLDEPTTGLFYTDVKKLLEIIHRIIDNNKSTVIFIEHNLDVLMSADYIIDLGPEGGEAGGELVASGTPEELMKKSKGYTAKFLKDYNSAIKNTKN
ncbi:MAG: excinuclease ABC subunit UvrA [Synergistaceae bacterium]|nr:excinuclease ABC subunit UvrA [Synergistaceae bacterium]